MPVDGNVAAYEAYEAMMEAQTAHAERLNDLIAAEIFKALPNSGPEMERMRDAWGALTYADAMRLSMAIEDAIQQSS